MSRTLEFDSRGLQDALNRIEGELKGEMMLKAVKAGGKILQQATQRELTAKLGAGATSTLTRKKPMVKGVTNKADKAYSEVRVSIMGDFRLKWFELGTGERYLKRTGAKDRSAGYTRGDKRRLFRKEGKEGMYRKGAYRGRIEGKHFFREARMSSEKDILTAIEESLFRQLDRLFK